MGAWVGLSFFLGSKWSSRFFSERGVLVLTETAMADVLF